jgi:hypothetical protein
MESDVMSMRRVRLLLAAVCLAALVVALRVHLLALARWLFRMGLRLATSRQIGRAVDDVATAVPGRT